MDDLILQLVGLKQYFPVHGGFFRSLQGYVKAVNGFDLELKRGTIHALVGESGSGKSTVARTALMLLKPTAGDILFNGIPIQGLSKEALLPYRRKMQMIFQDPQASLNPRHTIERSLIDAMAFHGLATEKRELEDRAVEMLEQVGMNGDALKRYPHQFSGGQQQRICIARALSLKPELLVCDEAVSALDVSVQAQILNLLLQLKSRFNLSLLFIAHDLDLVREVCDDVTVMYLGKEMERGSCKELFENPKHPYTKALLASTPRQHPDHVRERIPLKGEIPSPLNPPSGCPFRTRCPFAQKICAEPPPLQICSSSHRYFCILR